MLVCIYIHTWMDGAFICKGFRINKAGAFS